MTGTKGEILALLKRNGGHSVGELAAALRLAPITVRQHLTRLQRDGLVVSERSNRPQGRSSYTYRLTAKAHAAAFPRRSDRLAELLVREIGLLEAEDITGRSAQEKVSVVLQRLAERLAEDFAPLVQSWQLQERVAFVTEVMHADGGFAEWGAVAEGYEIRDFNCLFARLMQDTSEAEVCEWHRTFLTRMLGAEVQVSPCPDAARCCRFIVETKSRAGAVSLSASVV
jgi:predicted ArsR family transcriptional regulator